MRGLSLILEGFFPRLACNFLLGVFILFSFVVYFIRRCFRQFQILDVR